MLLLILKANKNILNNIIGRLAFGVAAYFIWQKRNLCSHNKGSRSTNQLFKDIFETVRCKIMSLRYKR